MLYSTILKFSLISPIIPKKCTYYSHVWDQRVPKEYESTIIMIIIAVKRYSWWLSYQQQTMFNTSAHLTAFVVWSHLRSKYRSANESTEVQNPLVTTPVLVLISGRGSSHNQVTPWVDLRMTVLYKYTASYRAPAVMNVIIQRGPDWVVNHSWHLVGAH